MSDKVCVVVGVGPGIGLAVARRFGREGYRLALLARQETALNQYVSELQSLGLTAQGFQADSADFAGLAATFATISQQLGQPSVLVYNAAIIQPGMPSSLSPDQLLKEFTVDVAGALVCAQQVIPAMRQQKAGTILLTGGGLSLQPAAFVSALSIGKAGIRSLAYSLGEELAADNIQVATITVCGTVTPGTFYDPDRIADSYWELHNQSGEQRQREIIFKQ